MPRGRRQAAVTRAKISAKLRSNKNAFRGGPKLTARQKVTNIRRATAAKRNTLAPEQISRRQTVAKRLRSQARREESLGDGATGSIPTVGSARSRDNLNPPARLKTTKDETSRRTRARTDAESSKTAKDRGTADILAGGMVAGSTLRERAEKEKFRQQERDIQALVRQKEEVNRSFALGRFTNKQRLSRLNSLSNQIEKIQNGGVTPDRGTTPKLTGSAARIDRAVRVGTVKRR